MCHVGTGKERNMKKEFAKKRIKNRVMVFMSLFLFTAVVLSGCGELDEREKQSTGSTAGVSQESQTSDENSEDSADGQDKAADDAANASAGKLEVCFGDKGNPFMLQLNDSDTAAAIARYVGTSDWRLPIYEEDEEVSEEYTPVGHFDATDEFVEAVKNNPVLEGWGNKIVLITKP